MNALRVGVFAIAVVTVFDAQRTGGIIPPSSVANMGGTNISVGVDGTNGQPCVTVQMSQGTSNVESAQLWQHLNLRRGVRYEVSCRMRWENFTPNAPAPIVNYGKDNKVLHARPYALDQQGPSDMKPQMILL